MVMVWIGSGFLAVAVFFFAFKLFVSFSTKGGADGMTPVMDGAILPPLAATFGMSVMTHWKGIVLFLFWLGTTLFAGMGIIVAGKLGAWMKRMQ